MALKGEAYFESDLRRDLDIARVAPLLAVTAIPTAIVALASMKEHRKLWPKFTHERIGRTVDGQPNLVSFPKIQTLPEETDDVRPYHHGPNHEDASRAAKVIRWTRLDEVPQLALVANGELGMFGIRTCEPRYTEQLEEVASASLFGEWKEWLGVTPAIFGRGDVEFGLRHGKLDKKLLVQKMEADVRGCETATPISDLRTFAAAPLVLFTHHHFGVLPRLDEQRAAA